MTVPWHRESEHQGQGPDRAGVSGGVERTLPRAASAPGIRKGLQERLPPATSRARGVLYRPWRHTSRSGHRWILEVNARSGKQGG